MKRYRLKRIPITSHSYMEQDMLDGKWVEFEDAMSAIRNQCERLHTNTTVSVCKNDLIGIHNALEYACAFIKAGRTQMDDVAHEQLLNAHKQCRMYTNGDPDEC